MAFQAMSAPTTEDPRKQASAGAEVKKLETLEEKIDHLVTLIQENKIDGTEISKAEERLSQEFSRAGQDLKLRAEVQRVGRKLADALGKHAKGEEGESEDPDQFKNKDVVQFSATRGYHGLVLKAVGLDPTKEK